MRYHIVSSFRGIEKQSQSREAAEQQYAEVVNGATAGETVQLIDTKKLDPKAGRTSTVLRTHYVQTEQEKAQRLEDSLNRLVDEGLARAATLITFAGKLTAQMDMDPTYELRWADRVFEHAAEYAVALRVRAYRADNVSWNDILTQLRREVMQEARSTSRSTSTCSNLMASCKLAALASMVDGIDNRMAW